MELQTKCSKYQKDLERLREHLLLIEENYTEEALQSREQERELREQLRVTEDHVAKTNGHYKEKRHVS